MARRSGRRVPALVGIFAEGVQVFRFYADGTVLDVLVEPAPGPRSGAVIARWLRREAPGPGVHSARYEQRGRDIAFTTRGHVGRGDIAVRGTWVDGRLTLSRAGEGWAVGPRLYTRLDGASGATRPGRGQGRPRR
ncbi:hypothetical protein ACFO4E_13195 [Nocardiopsis mangrovi]|uniref:Nuclear transport factor 2 family protein n=1 Tax=Nocardiopsis mangrovi TaxID=1179818 RepID=A0ABV9DV70_9ACTN